MFCLLGLGIGKELDPQNRGAAARKDRVLIADSFNKGQLDGSKWLTTRAHDFREAIVDVVDRASSPQPANPELRLRADTLGTDDRTVKYLGVVSRATIDLRRAKQVEFEIDWNRQANGSYLTAGIYLAPTLTRSSPEAEPTWLKFEYVGVPPGRHARAALTQRNQGVLRLLETEGWPDKQRTGRAIDKQKVALILDRRSIHIWENGVLWYQAKNLDLPFPSAHLYLQMSSHSNYPAREVFFDDIVVREASAGEKP